MSGAEDDVIRVGPFSFARDSWTYALCDRLHDGCRASGRACIGPEAHYIDVLNVVNALRERPVEHRMSAMGMEPFSHNWLDHLSESAGMTPPKLWIEAQ